jgi:hypothetical protein
MLASVMPGIAPGDTDIAARASVPAWSRPTLPVRVALASSPLPSVRPGIAPAPESMVARRGELLWAADPAVPVPVLPQPEEIVVRAALDPASGPSPAPTVVASAAAVAVPALAPGELPAADPPHGPASGLLLIAMTDEALVSLYAKVYQGVSPPPFEAVAAINPMHPHRGDLLNFPEPTGGWKLRRTAVR